MHYIAKTSISNHAMLLLLISMVMLLILLDNVSIAQSQLTGQELINKISNLTHCGSAQDGKSCVGMGCSWCGASYSCLPYDDSSLCMNECSFCSSLSTCQSGVFTTYDDVYPPPAKFDITCKNGGSKAWSSNFPFPDTYPETRFGGERCSCKSGWEGFDCGICTTNSSCLAYGNSQPVCNRGWIPRTTIPNRSMKCACVSSLCTGIMDAGPDVASISFDATLDTSSGDTSAVVVINKRIPLPSDRFKKTSGVDNQRDSTVMLRAKLSGCVVSQRVPCTEACKVGGCTESAVPWSSTDFCDVWVCQKAETDCPSKDALAGSGDRYDFHNEVCTNPLLNSALSPPFSVSCRSEKDGSLKKKKYCSFSTKTFAHGSLSLECSAGSCESEDDPIPPSVTKSLCFGGSAADSVCDNLSYALLIVVPLLLTLATIIGFFYLSHRQQGTPLRLKSQHFRLVESGPEDPSIVTSMAVLASPPQDDADTVAKNIAAAGGIIPTYTYIAIRQLSLFVRTDVREGSCRFMYKNAVSAPVEERNVLNDINMFIGGPQLLAILGPSGSGKTSLIDIISGRKNTGRVDGYIFMNGNQVKSGKELRQKIGYVMQDDVMPGTSTVKEYLSFHALLRYVPKDPKNIVRERFEKVNSIIRQLHLESCADTLIGDAYRKGASGGEQRRLSIGVELIAGKDVILMDEPTSGLDSSSSQHVVTALRSVVKSGKGVAVSIHQPSSRLFHQFDRVLLLSKQGQIIYMGDSRCMVGFFTSIGMPMPPEFNPAEFALDIVSTTPKENLETVIAAFQKTPMYITEGRTVDSICQKSSFPTSADEKLSQADSTNLPPFSRQFLALSGRFASNIIRHPVLPSVHIVATLVISIIAMILYFDLKDNLGGAINRAGFFFFFLSYITLSALADLGVWQEERIIFIRERAAGCYGSVAYMLSKFLCEVLPLRITPISIASFILTFGIGLQSDPLSLTIFMFVLILSSIIAVMLFLVVGMSINSPGVANFCAILAALFCLLMSGFLLIDFGYLTNDAPAQQTTSDSSTTDPDSLGELTGTKNTTSGTAITIRVVPFVLGYLSFLRPAFEILMVNELDGLSFDVSLVDSEGKTSTSSIALSGNVILAQLGLNVDDISLDFGVLCIWLGIFFTIATLLLTYSVVERR